MKKPQRIRLLYAIFFFSGAAGLGYQMAWTRMLAIGLGHEMPTVLAVVAAFFGGLALGAWTLDRPVSRSSRPGHWYIGLELLIAAWGLATIVLIPRVNALAGAWIGLEPSPPWQWFVAFGLPLAVLLPATTAMGATLPAMERFLAPRTSHGRVVGGLYAANTAGAVAGTLVSAFFLIPAWGYRITVITLAAINLLCAVSIWPLTRRSHVAATLEQETQARAPLEYPLWDVLVTVFFTGLLGIGYEVVGVRVISQVLENTVYSFAAVLSVYLVGTALGAWLYQTLGRSSAFDKLLGYLLCGLAAGCLVGGWTLSRTEAIYVVARSRLGDSIWAALLSEMIVAASVFLLPTTLMGATFSHLVQAARGREGGVGRAMAVNTLGGFVAPLLFGVVLLPLAGAKWALVALALGYLPLVPNWNKISWWALVAPLLLVLSLPNHLRLVTVSAGERLLDYREGVMAAVAVIGDSAGHRSLRVDNHFTMGSTSARASELRQGHVPLLLHAAPKRALFLGLGTGTTFEAAGPHPGLAADGVELVPEVVQVLPYFQSREVAPATETRLKVYVADARRFVRATADRFDVIVADLFHPGRGWGRNAVHSRAFSCNSPATPGRRIVLPMVAHVSAGRAHG